jgi:hypothetical protein
MDCKYAYRSGDSTLKSGSQEDSTRIRNAQKQGQEEEISVALRSRKLDQDSTC